MNKTINRRTLFAGMAVSGMGQSMSPYYNPSAAYGSINASLAAAAVQQSAAAMSAGLSASAQVTITEFTHHARPRNTWTCESTVPNGRPCPPWLCTSDNVFFFTNNPHNLCRISHGALVTVKHQTIRVSWGITDHRFAIPLCAGVINFEASQS